MTIKDLIEKLKEYENNLNEVEIIRQEYTDFIVDTEELHLEKIEVGKGGVVKIYLRP